MSHLPTVLVVGSSPCDLDSCASVLSGAFLLNALFSTTYQFKPCLTMSKMDFERVRSECWIAFGLCNPFAPVINDILFIKDNIDVPHNTVGIFLVDHHTPSIMLRNLGVLGIIDHHPQLIGEDDACDLSNKNLYELGLIDEKCGSCTSIIAGEIQKAGLRIPVYLALIMYSAVMRDTDHLTSPVTKDFDRNSAAYLAGVINQRGLTVEFVKSYIKSIKCVEQSAESLSLEDLILRDGKVYIFSNTLFHVVDLPFTFTSGYLITLYDYIKPQYFIAIFKHEQVIGESGRYIYINDDLLLQDLVKKNPDLFDFTNHSNVIKTNDHMSRKEFMKYIALIFNSVRKS